MEGIYLVQHYGSTSTRGRDQLHSGFVVGLQGGRYLIHQAFTDCTMLFIREHARALLGRDDEEIPVFVAQEDVLIYDGETLVVDTPCQRGIE